MLRFVLVRLVHGLVVVFLVTTLVFVILHLAPRDPVTPRHRRGAYDAEQVEHIRRFWGLDQPAAYSVSSMGCAQGGAQTLATRHRQVRLAVC